MANNEKCCPIDEPPTVETENEKKTGGNPTEQGNADDHTSGDFCDISGSSLKTSAHAVTGGNSFNSEANAVSKTIKSDKTNDEKGSFIADLVHSTPVENDNETEKTTLFEVSYYVFVFREPVNFKQVFLFLSNILMAIIQRGKYKICVCIF